MDDNGWIDDGKKKLIRRYDAVKEEPSSTKSNKSPVKMLCRLKQGSIRTLVLFVALILGVMVPHVGYVISLFGCFSATLLAFILPTAFHLKLKLGELGYFQIVQHFAIIASSSLISVAGVYYSVIA